MSRWLANLRVARNWAKLGSLAWAKSLQHAGVPLPDVEIAGNGRVRLKRLAIELRRADFERFAPGYRFAVRLKDAGAMFAETESDALSVTVDDLTLQVETAEELFILYEVFVERIYAYASGRPTVFLDVGANVGFASLFFAGLPETVAVRGFEPFPPTYQAALGNLARNPRLAVKATINEAAVLDSARDCQWKYSSKFRGSVGGFDSASAEADQVLTVRSVDAAAVVDDVVRRNPDVDLVVKLDCEGSEYAVVDRLSHTGMLRCVSAFLIEWHVMSSDHHPRRLVERFSEARFRAVTHGRAEDAVGMMYAFRSDG